tara:strand:+ start:222 stop:719 length:498 start_codon:yes stop_codon:yes gene_type:complete
MGFDVSGINPTINTTIEIYPTYYKYEQMSWKIKYDMMEKNDEKDIYFEEYHDYQAMNPGIYFRNNVWNWRPLWSYICEHCSNILTEDDMNSGCYNDGVRISKTKSLRIASRLSKLIKNGSVAAWEKEYSKINSDEDKSKFSYPFSEDNVKEFMIFCKESGGFEIW